uniref:UBX domain-containing protein n=1 Tax=Rhabditophanes sp. KR3021 TaxID=114890 RepID=A0AC35U3C0_9BILA
MNVRLSTEEKDQLITKFTEICMVDQETAKCFLRKYRYNYERAVQLFYQNNGVPDSDTDTEETALRHRRQHDNSDEVAGEGEPSTSDGRSPVASAAPTPNVNTAVTTWSIYSLFIVPSRCLFSLVNWFYSFFKTFIFGNTLAVTDPLGDVKSFVKSFQQKYDPEKETPFTRRSYDDTVKSAKENIKVLVVYLHSPNHQSTDSFCHNVLRNNEFLHFLNNNDLMLWGCSVSSQEGHKVAMALRENTYPYIGLISLRDHKMVLVQRITGILECKTLIKYLEQGLKSNERFIIEAKRKKALIRQEAQLRKDQEAEYQRTLAVDRAKKAERIRLETEKSQKEKAEREIAEAVAIKESRLASKIEQIREQVRELPEPSLEGLISVNVRFPNGYSSILKFNECDSLEYLFNAILIKEQCPKNFSLLSSYPRTSILCAPEWYREFSTCKTFDLEDRQIKSFQEGGYTKSFSIFISDNDA